jgi:hypothetical protein
LIVEIDSTFSMEFAFVGLVHPEDGLNDQLLVVVRATLSEKDFGRLLGDHEIGERLRRRVARMKSEFFRKPKNSL